MEKITSELLEKIKSNEKIKRKLAYKDPLWFSFSYLRHHFEYSLAPFHIEMFYLIKQTDCDFITVMAFRESGKSTIMNMANVLWSILGKPQKKFVIIISKSQEQAKSQFASIKMELENNESLKNDFGPFIEEKDDFKKLSLELTYHDSKIISIDRDQSIRGLKYGQFRPDLIICDDLEDISSVFNQKESDEFYERFQREIVPLGSLGTRIIILGNLLSDRSLITRVKENILTNKIEGVFKIYPFLDDNGKILWTQKFSDSETLKKLLSKLSKEAWKQEYLLGTNGWDGYYKEVNLFYSDKDESPYYKLSCEYDQKLEELYQRYKHKILSENLQTPLVKQMEEFTISVSINENEFPEELPEDDPRYEYCCQFNTEKEKLTKKFEEEYRLMLIIQSAKKDGLSQKQIDSIISDRKKKLTAEDVEWDDDSTDIFKRLQ
ncbi:MAG: hypothetical protein PHW72_01455 [Candidatus Pacebacteria bacterium]|nr:hypothetical protein [Candidatus Paceibacterota bacterium]